MADKKIAIFDFCDTIFNGQSVSYFINFLNSKLPIYKKIYTAIRRKFSPPSTNSKAYKEFLLKSFYGTDINTLNKISKEFLEKIILPNLHQKVMQKLKEHKENGDMLIIVSGGFENYLELFRQKFNIDHLVCTKLAIKEGKFIAKIDGKECLGEIKIKKLKEAVNLAEFDLQNSYVYSDSISDKPLFSLVGNKIIVKNHQNIDWADDTFKILDVKR